MWWWQRARVTATAPNKPRYTGTGCSGRRATSALTTRRRHGRSHPGARVRWAALAGGSVLPAPHQLLPNVRRPGRSLLTQSLDGSTAEYWVLASIAVLECGKDGLFVIIMERNQQFLAPTLCG